MARKALKGCSFSVDTNDNSSRKGIHGSNWLCQRSGAVSSISLSSSDNRQRDGPICFAEWYIARTISRVGLTDVTGMTTSLPDLIAIDHILHDHHMISVAEIRGSAGTRGLR